MSTEHVSLRTVSAARLSGTSRKPCACGAVCLAGSVPRRRRRRRPTFNGGGRARALRCRRGRRQCRCRSMRAVRISGVPAETLRPSPLALETTAGKPRRQWGLKVRVDCFFGWVLGTITMAYLSKYVGKGSVSTNTAEFCIIFSLSFTHGKMSGSSFIRFLLPPPSPRPLCARPPHRPFVRPPSVRRPSVRPFVRSSVRSSAVRPSHRPSVRPSAGRSVVVLCAVGR